MNKVIDKFRKKKCFLLEAFEELIDFWSDGALQIRKTERNFG